MRQLQHFRGMIDSLLDLRFLGAGQFQTERHVVGHGEMRVQRVGLEYHADAAFGRRYLVHAAVTDHQIAGGDIFQTGNHAQQGGFAAAGRTDKDHKFPVIDLQIDVFGDRCLAVGFAYITQCHARHELLLTT